LLRGIESLLFFSLFSAPLAHRRSANGKSSTTGCHSFRAFVVVIG
jgi:hypothetical protein